MKYFRHFIKELRIQRDVTLREFCLALKFDPSNWSRIERGIADPPKSNELLNKITTFLKLNKEETNMLMDLAMIESIPIKLRPSEDMLEKLPILFKTLRGEKPTEEELRKLIKKLNNI